MTAAPLDVLATPPAATTGTPGANPGADGALDPSLFAVLVDQALAAADPEAEAEPETETETDAPESGQDAAPEVVTSPWAGLCALVAVVATAAREATAQPTGQPDAESTGKPASGLSAATTSTPVPEATASSTAPAASALPAVSTQAEATTARPAPAAAPATTEEPSKAARPVDPGSVPVVTGGSASVAPGAAPAQSGDAQPARSVVTQVIPEITRLVSDGEGVHRVTLQLNPKALGEVRVVLTMRHGDVHVRIAGGEEARHALAASSGELTRALQHLGIEDHRLTLTDLAPAPANRGAGTELHDQAQNRHHSPGGNHQDPHGQNSHSWMGDARSATDGSSTSSPTDRTRGSDRVHEASHARVAGGVDLRM